MRPSLADRNRKIAEAVHLQKRSLSDVGREFGLNKSTIKRAADAGKELFATPGTVTTTTTYQPTSTTTNGISQAGGALFSETTSTGLRRQGGMILEDYDRVFQSLPKRVAMFKEMGDDPIVSAVMNAIKMTLRRVGWYVEPGGETPADREAAEFVDSCLHDMSQTWGDTLDQSLDMLQYGFQLAELVYKRREGQKEEAGSKYDDGKIGWRKWVFIAPDSLYPGDEWIFDPMGGIQGFRQFDVYKPNANLIEIPIHKAILFRTTVSRGNPEGRSLLRAMWQPYWFKHNLEEVEAISAERLGSGFPVFYAGTDVGKGTGANGDLETLKDIVRNVRVDEQMGLVLPWAKMGSGAEPGKGVLFELLSPPGKGSVDFHVTITRHEQRMAMVGLAQFIHLGMAGVGARSLGESSQDFFTLAVSAWADAIADTLNRYAVDRLMRLNFFPGLTANPKLMHESVSGTNLIQIADYINKLAGAQLITPSQELEEYIRTQADLPVSELDRIYHEKVMKEKKAAEMEAKKAAQPPAPNPFMRQPQPEGKPMPEQDDDKSDGGEAPDVDKPEVEQNSALLDYFDANHTGVMVALYLDPASAQAIAIPDGERPEDLHVTLAYLGDSRLLSPDKQERLKRVVSSFATIAPPVSGKIAGPAEFQGGGEGKPVVLLYDAPSLPNWRQYLAETLRMSGYQLNREHGYIPHITLKYADNRERVKIDPPKFGLLFDTVSLVIGGNRFDYKLTGEASQEVFAVPKKTQRNQLARSAELLANEIRAARQAIGPETMAVGTRSDNFAVTALVEKFAELVNALTTQAPPTIIVTNEVKPAPVTVLQQHPRFSTEETTIKRGNGGEMLGSTTRVTHEYIDGE